MIHPRRTYIHPPLHRVTRQRERLPAHLLKSICSAAERLEGDELDSLAEAGQVLGNCLRIEVA